MKKIQASLAYVKPSNSKTNPVVYLTIVYIMSTVLTVI